MFRSFPCLLLSATVLVATPAEALQSYVVGHWYGEKQPSNPNVYWIAFLAPDGVYSATFRWCLRHIAHDSHETGTWALRDRKLEVITLSDDGHAVYQDDTYRTQSYDGHKHVYRHDQTGFVFSAVRVDDKFALPSCDLTS